MATWEFCELPCMNSVAITLKINYFMEDSMDIENMFQYLKLFIFANFNKNKIWILLIWLHLL